VQLTRECQSALLAAQARVQQLVERPEGATVVDFNATDE
jgi:exonuclease VII small subunit